jgi:rod shape-determining protein MreD
MTAVAHLLTMYFLLGFESALLLQLGLSFHAPDLTAVAVVYLALRVGFFEGLLTVMLLGLLQDGFSMGAPVGIHVEAFVLLFLLARRLGARILVSSPIATMVVGFLASAIAQAGVLLLTAVFDRTYGEFSQGVAGVIPNALVTAPFAPLVFWILAWAGGLVSPRRTGDMFRR